MTKKISVFVLCLCLLFCLPIFYACDEIVPKTLNIFGAQKTFVVGDKFTLGEDALVSLQYDDNTKNCTLTTEDFQYSSKQATSQKVIVDFSQFNNKTIGTYTITVCYSALPNDKTLTKTYTVSVLPQANYWLSAPKINNWTYGEISSTPSADAKYGTNGQIVFEYKKQGTPNSSYSTTKPSSAGNYVMRAKITDVPNTKDLSSEVNFTIYKKQISVPTIETKEYNNSSLKATILASENYAIVFNQSGITAGNYAVILRLTDPKNTKWENSDAERINLIFTITKANNSWLTRPQILNWNYGETPSNPIDGTTKFSSNIEMTYLFALKNAPDNSLLTYTTLAELEDNDGFIPSGTYVMKATANGNSNVKDLVAYVEFSVL